MASRLISALALPIVLFSACAYGPETKSDSPLAALNGKNYETTGGPTPTQNVALPIVKRRRALSHVSGKLVNQDISGNISNLQLSLLFKNEVISTTRTNAGGEFKFTGDFPNGKLVIQAGGSGKTWDVELHGHERSGLLLPL